MLRSVVLGVADRKLVRRAVTTGPGRRVAERFVAGETLDQALVAVRDLNAASRAVSLDHLGENVTDEAQARADAAVYREALARFAAEGSRANVSVKLTQMGLDFDEALARELSTSIVVAAEQADTTVTLDMEDHRYTDRTLQACLALHAERPGRVGVAVQAYLKRTPKDLDALAEAGVPVRLCKGAYKEPRAIAHQGREKVDEAYRALAVRLLSSSSYAMIATHDEALIRHAIEQARALTRDPATFEFQLLYGVRRDLQARLVEEGFAVRVYVPFGSQWYPYLMRRIAERPANVRFFAEALLRG